MTKKQINNLSLIDAFELIKKYSIKVKKFETSHSEIKSLARKIIDLEKIAKRDHYPDHSCLHEDMRNIWVKRELNQIKINI